MFGLFKSKNPENTMLATVKHQYTTMNSDKHSSYYLTFRKYAAVDAQAYIFQNCGSFRKFMSSARDLQERLLKDLDLKVHNRSENEDYASELGYLIVILLLKASMQGNKQHAAEYYMLLKQDGAIVERFMSDD